MGNGKRGKAACQTKLSRFLNDLFVLIRVIRINLRLVVGFIVSSVGLSTHTYNLHPQPETHSSRGRGR